MATQFFHSNSAQATGLHACKFEMLLLTTTSASADLQTDNIGGGNDDTTHVYTTEVGEPGFAQWPLGQYDTIIRVPTVGTLMRFGILTQGGSNGHFARVNSALTVEEDTWTQTQSEFNGIGSHLASRTIDPTGDPDAADRLEVLVAARNIDAMGNLKLTLRVNTAESETNGPWGLVTVDFTQVMATVGAAILGLISSLATMFMRAFLPPRWQPRAMRLCCCTGCLR